MSTQSALQNSIIAANRMIADHRKRINEARAQNREYEAKIQQLEAAKQHAEWAGYNADHLKQCLYQVQPGEWAGTNWDSFRDATHGGEAYARAKGLHHGCDGLRDEIQAEIDRARAQIDHLADIIGGAQDAIAYWGRQVTSFTNRLKELG